MGEGGHGMMMDPHMMGHHQHHYKSFIDGGKGDMTNPETMQKSQQHMENMEQRLVSYAAGLTPITLWRFSLATFLGLIPASFLLAHLGGEMTEANYYSTTLIVLIIGMATLIPFLFKALNPNQQKRSEDQ